MEIDIAHLIQHPEEMDKETLYDLRSLLAVYPYFQTARILMLQNLYLLHDSSFDEELRRAAVYITDRRVIFQMIEAAHYKIRNAKSPTQDAQKENGGSDRTSALIDDFLDSIPKDNEEDKKTSRKKMPADPSRDYISYLLEMEDDQTQGGGQDGNNGDGHPQDGKAGSRTVDLIDNFLEDGGFNLNFDDDSPTAQVRGAADSPADEPLEHGDNENVAEGNQGYFTETLARIYIKQGHYEKALEIIKQLNLNNSKKNAYFADQKRFLQKLIINSKYNK